MTALEIFKAAARRWQLLLVFVVLGATAAFLIGPPKDRAPEVTHEATHTVGPLPNDPTLTASRLALLVSHPDVVGPVAEAFGYPDNFALLDQVAIVPNDTTLTLALTTRQPTPAMAVGIADGLANGLIELLKAEDRAAQEVQLADVQAELAELRAELQGLAAQGGVESPDPAIQSQAQGVQALLGQKLGEERALSQEPDPRVRTVIAATPHAIEVGGFSTPLNRPAMTLIGLVFGLGLGVALAVMFNHLDSRLRTVADVVESFNIAVIGQVPTAPRSSRGYQVVTYEQPNSALSEAHRSIRTRLSALAEGVHQLRPQPDWRDAAVGANGHSRAGRVFLVTSAGVGDGKSTTVANLAAAFADAGRSIIVVSGDLRSPSIHRYLDVPDDAPGLGDDMGDMTVADVEQLLQPTSLPNVRLLSHGSLVSNPGELLAAHLPAIAATRVLADVVLIDSPPVLAANDATELLPVVDGVLVVARLGRTRRNAAHSAADLLESLNAPVVGVVAVEATSDHAIYGYFGRGTGKDAGPVRAHARIVRPAVEKAPTEDIVEVGDESASADDTSEPAGIASMQVPAVGSWSSWRTR